MKTHQVLNRLSKCANVRYCKNRVFLWFTNNSQWKLEKFSTLFLRYLPRKTTKLKKVSWWNLWIGDTRKFHNSFFIKNYYLNLFLFSSTEECLTVDIAIGRRKTVKKEKRKQKIRISQITGFLLLLFYIGKFIFC